MVKHIVFWKIKDSNDKQQNIDHMIDMLTNLVGKIDGLVSVEMGYNFNTSSDYDVVLYAALKNAAALKYYQNHPEHIKCKDFIEKITEARVAADYFYEEEITQSRPFDEVPDAPEIKENVKPEITVEKPVAKKPVIEVSKPDAKETATKVSKSAAKMTATEVSKSVAAPVQNSTVTEKTNIFGKKKVDVQVTPLEQRSDTWTCPACGKIMPNYVGTCGCGEPKPFEFEPPVPADSADTSVSARSENKPSAKPGPRRENIKESKSFFSKKKPETSSPVPSSGSNTWTCPNCGKIMPNYVGTCGCGEPKPFEFESSEPADSSEVIFPNAATGRQNKVSPEMAAEFENVQPSIQGYNPQVNVPDDSTHSNMDFIKNDNIPKNETYENYSTFDMSFNQPKSQDSSFAPLDFENAPPPAPMRFSDEPPASMGFGNRAPTSMKFSDAPGAYQDNSINSANNAAQPMRFSSSPAPSPQPAPKHVKEERKRRFGKKAKEDEAFRQAQEIVNNRKDVPNDGTWTCPNCGKVMPKYVGTCGCGESQPFEF